jgi:hypothetical protein
MNPKNNVAVIGTMVTVWRDFTRRHGEGTRYLLAGGRAAFFLAKNVVLIRPLARLAIQQPWEK